MSPFIPLYGVCTFVAPTTCMITSMEFKNSRHLPGKTSQPKFKE